MKILLFIIVLFGSSGVQAFSNEPYLANRNRLGNLRFIALYNKHWQEDSTDVYSMREEPMILLLSSEQSKFYSFNSHFMRDSIAPRYPLNQWNALSFKYPRPRNFYRVFKNHHQKKINFYDRVSVDLLTYSLPLQLFQWQILPDKQQMFGYVVQKATTSFAGRDWVAWFAPEIPISDGPYKFNGLPGLIVLLHDTRNHYRFALTSFVKINCKNRFLEKCEGMKRSAFATTWEKIFEMRRQFIQNPFGFLPNVTHHGGEAQRQEVLERIRRRNNMLELRY